MRNDKERLFRIIASDRQGDLQRSADGIEDGITRLDKARVSKLFRIDGMDPKHKAAILLETGVIKSKNKI